MDTKILNMLKVAYSYELQAYHSYLHAFCTVTGELEPVYSSLYRDLMDGELHHLKELGRKIRVLGGMPPMDYPSIEGINNAIENGGYAETLEQLKKEEAVAIKLYTNLRLAAEEEGDQPLVLLIEEILLEEQEHFDRIERTLMDNDKPKTIEARIKNRVQKLAILSDDDRYDAEQIILQKIKDIQNKLYAIEQKAKNTPDYMLRGDPEYVFLTKREEALITELDNLSPELVPEDDDIDNYGDYNQDEFDAPMEEVEIPDMSNYQKESYHDHNDDPDELDFASVMKDFK